MVCTPLLKAQAPGPTRAEGLGRARGGTRLFHGCPRACDLGWGVGISGEGIDGMRFIRVRSTGVAPVGLVAKLGKIFVTGWSRAFLEGWSCPELVNADPCKTVFAINIKAVA